MLWLQNAFLAALPPLWSLVSNSCSKWMQHILLVALPPPSSTSWPHWVLIQFWRKTIWWMSCIFLWFSFHSLIPKRHWRRSPLVAFLFFLFYVYIKLMQNDFLSALHPPGGQAWSSFGCLASALSFFSFSSYTSLKQNELTSCIASCCLNPMLTQRGCKKTVMAPFSPSWGCSDAKLTQNDFLVPFMRFFDLEFLSPPDLRRGYICQLWAWGGGTFANKLLNMQFPSINCIKKP